VCVYNTDRRVLVEIQHGWGGFLSVVGQRRPAWKPSYALIWTNAAAAKVLQKVAPYLRVKSEQAAALLEFNEHVRACRRIRDPGGRLLRLTERELVVRAAFHDRLRRLNMKGKSVCPGASLNSSPSRTNLSSTYLAGFIDAEGCLMIPKSTDANGRSHYSARISVGNTDRSVLEEIRAQFGGIMTNHPPQKVGWSYAYQLIWSDGMVESLLKAVMPYLVAKRRQAMIMLDLVHHKKSTHQGRNARGFARHPEAVAAFRENLRRQIKELNAKGPSPAPIEIFPAPAVSPE
jgi:LAGLIDADG endonuclease